MQTILGAGGAAGTAIAKELTKYTNHIRLVARNPKKVNATDELFTADLTNALQVQQAVANSEVVYLCAGLQYKYSIWKTQWPLVMKNVIDACVHHQSKLVFVDNVYMYAKDAIPHMTEESVINPPSKKGQVRKQILDMLLEAVKNKKLQALIARSADFYGPNVANSMLTITVVNNFKKGKRAMWLSDASKLHSFTYVPDLGKATALLGNTSDAYNQTWHLPTSNEKLTGKQFIEITAAAMNIKPKFSVLGEFMLGALGIFMPMLRELKEMQYQNNQDYFFDSSKFENRFGITATSYTDGIKEMVK